MTAAPVLYDNAAPRYLPHLEYPKVLSMSLAPLLRLPESGAVAFTIRTYLHPLWMLERVPGALPALLAAIDQAPPAIVRYKGLDTLAPALARFRKHTDRRENDTAEA